MAIDHLGRLERAVSDGCQNYDPIRGKETGVISAISGPIYVCKKYEFAKERFSDMKDPGQNACLFCYNWQDPEMVYKNRED